VDAVEPAPAAESLLPPAATSDGTLRRLQEVALTCFGERGYHGVSIRDLARAAGIQPSSIYAHVSSKEELLFDIALLGHETQRDEADAAVLAAGPDPSDQLRAYVRAHVHMHATYRMLARVCNRELAALSPEHADAVWAIRDASVRLLQGVLARGERLGAFEFEDSYLVAAAINGMGIRVAEWWDPSDSHSADQLADTYAELAMKMVVRPGGAPGRAKGRTGR
jgi:AcrR family transcriptional regulator